MEVIVTRWNVNWSDIWCCCSLSKVVVLSRITTTNCSTVLLLVPTAYLTLFIRPKVQVNIVVASVDGHMADDQVRTSLKVAQGTPKCRSS